MTLDKALTMNPELRKLYESDEQVHVAHRYESKRLEGLAAPHLHARGGRRDLPGGRGSILYRFHEASDGSITTQFTMTTLEELGLSENGLSGAANPDSNSRTRSSMASSMTPDVKLDMETSGL